VYLSDIKCVILVKSEVNLTMYPTVVLLMRIIYSMLIECQGLNSKSEILIIIYRCKTLPEV